MAERSNDTAQRPADRISSPEQLADYFKVTNAGVWLILAAVIALLAGLFIWACIGRIESVEDARAVVKDSQAIIYPSDGSKVELRSGMILRIDDDEFTIKDVMRDDQGRSVAFANVTASDGEYSSEIVLESIHPISFLFD